MINKLKLYICIKLFALQSKSLLHDDIIYEYIKINEDKKNKKDIHKLYIQLRKLILKDVNRNIDIYNYDEINLILKKQHNYLFNASVLTLQKYYDENIKIIDEFTRAFISIRDGKIVYKYWNNEHDENLIGTANNKIKIHIMEYLMRYIPIDIFMINFIVLNEKCDINQLDGMYSVISMADLMLEKILEKGVAENHLHMGAGFNFLISWQEMTRDIFFDVNRVNYRIYDNENFEKYVLYSSFIRTILSCYINTYKDNNNLAEYIFNLLGENRLFAEQILNNEILECEVSKQMVQEVVKHNGINYDVHGNSKDVVLSIFEIDIDTSGENVFLYKTLEFIKSDYVCDTFKMLFIKYIKMKNYIYSEIVQCNEMNGLEAFKEYYAKASNTTNNKVNYWEELLKYNFQNTYLKKLEGRMSIKTNYEKFRVDVKNILVAYKKVLNESSINQKGITRLGIVFHFIKEKQKEENIKCWKSYDQSRETTASFISYKELQERYNTQLENLLKIREENAYLSEFLLGIDAASGENDTSVCVFAPVFASARDGKTDLFIQHDKKSCERIPQKSLMFTFHAGEDFRHILSGLRKIDEVVEHCKFHNGDRIGHGIALSCDVDFWQKKYLISAIPRFEHLENLLWVWGVFSKQTTNIEVSMYLEKQILKYAKEIYVNMNGITVLMLYEAYIESFKGLKEIFDKNKSYDNHNENDNFNDKIFCIKVCDEHNLMWKTDKLIYSRNCSCFLERMNETIFVEITDNDVEIIKKMQEITVNKLSNKGIVVEMNPTSNIAIGEISDINKHHVFSLQNIENNENLKKVIVNVNTDDPTVFSNNISNEFALLYYSLESKEYSKDEILEWIEKIRLFGMSTSFISDRLSDEQYISYLDKAIEFL